MHPDPSQQLLPLWLLAATFGLLVILSGVFAGAEMAVFALGRSGRLRRRVNSGRFVRVRRLLDHTERTLTTVKLAILVLNLAAALTAARAARGLWPVGGFAATWAGLGVAAAALFVFAAALPRALAARRPEGFALRAAPLLEAAVVLLTPLRGPAHWLASRLVPTPFTSQQISKSIQGEEEFKALLGTTEVSGLLHEDEREMIDSVFEFAETTADEIMTPRTDIEGCPIDLTQEEILEAMRQTPFSRVVIYEDTLDRIVGVLHAKEMLLNPAVPWREFLHKPIFVPSSMELDDLLAHFKRSHSRLAVVLDEFGGTAGLVTMHDLIEEIVGEMPEEEEGPGRDIDPIEPGAWLVAGRVELAALNDALDTAFPEDKARTVAGLVFTHLGQVPEVGQELELADARIRVIELEENRIERLEIRLPQKERAVEAVEAQARETPGRVVNAGEVPAGRMGEREANARELAGRDAHAKESVPASLSRPKEEEGGESESSRGDGRAAK